MVSHDTDAIETRDDPGMVSLPHVDVVEAGGESTGSLRGILTGVAAGGLIWLGVLAYLVL